MTDLARRWTALVVVVVSTSACHSAGDSPSIGDASPGSVCTDILDCGLSDVQLADCSMIDAGVYGRGEETCEGSGCPQKHFDYCGNGISVTASVGDASVGEATLANGHYALTLDPGTYTICCAVGASIQPTCVTVDIAPNQNVRVDAEHLISAGGGNQCLMQMK